MIWILLPTALIFALAAIIPTIPISHGFVRAFDFPRIQSALLSLSLFALSILFLDSNFEGLLAAGLFAFSTLVHLSYIIRFTPIWLQRSSKFDGDTKTADTIRLIVSNVKMGNRDYGKLQRLIKEKSADTALFMEVDEDWVQALDECTTDYPYRLSEPNDNSYGMHLVSRFKFNDSSINFLLKDEVPSFDISFEHTSGHKFRMIAIHPEPPVPDQASVGRDAEIALVGEKVRDYRDPLIVTGDLNDVAWSKTTRRFMRISRLLDPREGRGLFNTFDARCFFLRWPLDHIFHSSHFQLISIARLPFMGSDHFPMQFDLALANEKNRRRSAEKATGDDLAEADEVIRKEKQRGDRPAGTDWED